MKVLLFQKSLRSANWFPDTLDLHVGPRHGTVSLWPPRPLQTCIPKMSWFFGIEVIECEPPESAYLVDEKFYLL